GSELRGGFSSLWASAGRALSASTPAAASTREVRVRIMATAYARPRVGATRGPADPGPSAGAGRNRPARALEQDRPSPPGRCTTRARLLSLGMGPRFLRAGPSDRDRRTGRVDDTEPPRRRVGPRGAYTRSR